MIYIFVKIYAIGSSVISTLFRDDQTSILFATALDKGWKINIKLNI